MKTSVAIVASVLLAGVALDVTAFSVYSQRENENSQWPSMTQRVRSQSSSDVSPNQEHTVNLGEFDDEYINDNNKNHHGPMRINKEYAVEKINRYQTNGNDESSMEYSLYKRQPEGRRYHTASSGITKKIVDKITAIQKIAIDRSAEQIDHLNRDIEINKSVIKMSGHNFVTFYNATMKNLEAGHLESLYINPGRDTVYVLYKFDQLKTVGSFKSNDAYFKSGYYTIVLNKINSTVTTGFENNLQRPALEPAKFLYADADIVTENGTETQAFNDALEHRYLRVLGNAVCNEVLQSTGRGMVAQLKNEIRKPIAIAQNAADNKAKLFDMKWTEDDFSMEMSNVGFRDSTAVSQQADRLFNSVVFQRKSENAYSMGYDFVLTGLEWTSVLTVEYAGNKMNTRPTNFKIEKVDLRVTVFKSLDRPQQQQNSECEKVNTDIEITGLQYEFDDEMAAVQSELLSLAKAKLQRYMVRSLESHFQNSVKQAICNHNNNNNNNNNNY
ncbi:Hypothetical protein CINCED_3A019155 [Cinara cedri]|uniref:Uncharacterized protein n=1 Tax=Cinara cedri TaxID=506608 RepID=A0A5E4MGX0_9HEMI|nr:Hypothetical protein CINCED_3A019155 [Cinara cedri]